MLRKLSLDHASVLERANNWGIKCDYFFDVGAAKGQFGHLIRQTWPHARIDFFEAAPYWTDELEQTKQTLGGDIQINIAAVGATESTKYFRFDPNNPTGGALLDVPGPKTKTIEVPVISLDKYIADNSLSGPFVLKLDVHGAEKSILSGARNFMKECELIIFETYNFGPAHRRFAQMSLLLEEEYGMHCLDIAEPSWRDYDGALWQIDFYFAKFEGTRLSEWRLR